MVKTMCHSFRPDAAVRRLRQLLRSIVVCLVMTPAPLVADAEFRDPHDPFSREIVHDDDQNADREKTAEQLILEAKIFLDDERLLDARTKLLRALEREPDRYEAHILLAGYYLGHVGHFRLALKYIKQAERLFEQQAGPPPYIDPKRAQEHAQILYLTSQIRLNLDDYQGSLDLLDKFSSYNYYSTWYPGSRAWVLMKLGQIDEAIKVARLGVLLGAEPGRTLNMLGILLSMKGERESSLQVFKEAMNYEFSLGSDGQPATPLNNSGEVYKEMFLEDQAEQSWVRATSLPDGCEHVLPSLNLALLYIDQLNLKAASQTMDRFEGCIAQFPLRNGEEHRSLVHLARGRIDLYRGNVDSAIAHFETALDGRQWFGKIGTDQRDLEAGLSLSLAQALLRKNNHLALIPHSSLADMVNSLRETTLNDIRAWWLFRRAKQVLAEDLTSLEDLSIRNTDSLIEYPTFGELLSRFPLRTAEQRLTLESELDPRVPAQAYYRAYLAESYLAHGETRKGIAFLDEVLKSVRPRYDNALKLHALMLQLSLLDPESDAYALLSSEIFILSRPALRNYGHRLPVRVIGAPPEVIETLAEYPFAVTGKATPYEITYSLEGREHQLYFSTNNGVIGGIRAKGEDLEGVISTLINAVFVDEGRSER